MQKPANVEGPIDTARWMAGQAWRDLMSVYYANTPVWRWLKSGALVFLGLFVWAGASVVYSLRPAWTFLLVFMAYGFLLVFWGPLTHMLIVPLVLRLRRTAEHPVVRRVARHGSKLNLAIFLTLVATFALVQPGIMVLEFSPSDGANGGDVRGEVECSDPVDGTITCEIQNPEGFDHAVVTVNGDVLARDDEAPYELEFRRDELDGDRYLVQLRNADGRPMRTFSQTV